MFFEISDKVLNTSDLNARLVDPHSGGFVEFEGRVRNHNEGVAVLRLEYEAYSKLSRSEGQKILAEAMDRYGILDVACVHRVGDLNIGEVAVWIGASAVHRDEAFRACRYVIDEVKLRLPVWKKEHYIDGRAEWVNCQECYKHSHHYSSADEEQEFYSRQMALPEIAVNGQDQLAKSRVLVVGAGGLGVPVLKNLAGAGVGSIDVYDSDKLETSNLHRQNIYAFSDVGKAKAILAEEFLQRYNPFIGVRGHAARVDEQNIMKVLEGVDLVIECTDNMRSKYLIHDACHVRGIPLIAGSVYRFEGEVHTFSNVEGSPCLRCFAPVAPSDECVGNCSELGTISYVTEIVGSIQAKMAIDCLLRGALRDEKVIMDLKTIEFQTFKIRKNDHCVFCSSSPIQLNMALFEAPLDWEVEVDDLSQDQFRCLDIRGAVASDMDRYLQLPANFKYLLICQRGVSSRGLVRKLREEGHREQFYSLRGGFNALDAKNVRVNCY